MVVVVDRRAVRAPEESVTDRDGRRQVVGRERGYRRGEDLFEVGAGIPPATDRLHQHTTGVEQHGARPASRCHIAECMRYLHLNLRNGPFAAHSRPTRF
jgi:hypothetical protein